MDSKETKNLKELLGSIGYLLLKHQLRNVKLKINREKEIVSITKNGITFPISFGEIERISAHFSQ